MNELEQALAAYEEVEQANSSSIKQAKACIDLLRELKDDGDMQFLEKALRHAYDVKTKHNTIIQRAEDTLVAYYEKGTGFDKELPKFRQTIFCRVQEREQKQEHLLLQNPCGY